MIDNEGNLVLVENATETKEKKPARLPLEMFALLALVKLLTGHGVTTEKGHTLSGLRDYVKRNKYEDGIEALIVKYYEEVDPQAEANEKAKREAERAKRKAETEERKAKRRAEIDAFFSICA